MKDVKTLLLELVAVGSTSETPGEAAMGHKILELIREDPYFSAHPDHCGAFDGGDRLGRPVVWALKKGTGSKTVVFSGHYDTVDTRSYGVFEPLALTPDTLRAAMVKSPPEDDGIRRALKDERWMFGRGVADMKAGIALNIHTLYHHQPGEVNVLVTAVSDEENLSAGARQAVPLYKELAARFGLTYAIGVESEPSTRDVAADGPVPLIHGCAGKILPVVVAKGIPVHSSNMLSGINSARLIAGIIRQTEYDTAFVSQGGNMFTEPPAAQLVRDMKAGYDVSMPEYTACAFNMTFFSQTDPSALLDRLVDNCRQAVSDLQARYAQCFDAMAGAGQIDSAKRRDYDIRVLTLMELEAELAGRPGFEDFRAQAKIRCQGLVEGGETMQWAAICYIRDMMAFSGIAQPFVVVGIAPPYYPAVHTDYLGHDIGSIVSDAIGALAAQGVRAAREEYSQAMMDPSYMACQNPDSARRVMGNMPLPRSLYDMDIDAMAALDIPTLIIGPARRDIHQIGERVWLPDVETLLPKVFAQIIASTEKLG